MKYRLRQWRGWIILVILVVLFWYRTDSWPIAAVVNYRPIWRWELDAAMYAQIGPQAVDNLVIESLVQDELDKKQVTISGADVDSRLNEIKTQIGSDAEFEQALAFQGLTQEKLQAQVKMQLGLEKLVEPATDSAVLAERVYDLVAKLRTEAKIWIIRR